MSLREADGGPVLVVHDQVDVAVVVQVAVGEASPDVVGVEVGPCTTGGELELSRHFTLRCSKAGSA